MTVGDGVGLAEELLGAELLSDGLDPLALVLPLSWALEQPTTASAVITHRTGTRREDLAATSSR